MIAITANSSGICGSKLNNAPEEVLDGAFQRLHLETFFDGLRDGFNTGTQIGFFLQIFDNANPFQALDKQPNGAVGRLKHAMDLGRGADLVYLVGTRLIGIFVTARDQGNDAIARKILIHKTQAAFLSDGQGKPHHRIDNHAA